jgi:hypothetical protein
MFSIVGGLLSTALIAVATYVIATQPAPVTRTVEHSVIVASQSTDHSTVRK